ncbi:hypothetical protein [Rhodopirellula halodulae]|uniref:hypothetical protein n=1 Tax=Rhodopirellula halodulae TaxID=2894198 RepID=UPI001E5476FB|nr:hypothetical protein [Rhodopirellula sp. JC737]MCC9656742.1 hypothetical protein [Rhodopirellula sp. JC737]
MSIGVAIYCLTEWLGIPYDWAVFIVVIRAAFWATVVDIRKFDINIEGKTLSGPTFIFGSKQASVDLTDVEPEFVGECMGAFSLHDSTGEEVMAHTRQKIVQSFVGWSIVFAGHATQYPLDNHAMMTERWWRRTWHSNHIARHRPHIANVTRTR